MLTCGDLRRRQRLRDEVGEVLAERHDVDLLAAHLVDDHAHTPATGPDARADGIDVVVVRPDGDLGAVTRFTGAGLDLDDAVGDLGHFEFEQALDQARVRARHDDLRALRRAADLDDVRLLAVALGGTLERHLLGLRQQRLDPTEVEQRVAGVGALDDAGDDVALAVRVLLELALGLDLADALAHHLAEGLRGDAAELFLLRRVVALVDPVAVFVDVVGDERELHRLGVDLDDDFVGGVRAALVGRSECVDEDVQQRVLGDALLLGQHADGLAHVEVAHDGCFSLFDGGRR